MLSSEPHLDADVFECIRCQCDLLSHAIGNIMLPVFCCEFHGNASTNSKLLWWTSWEMLGKVEIVLVIRIISLVSFCVVIGFHPCCGVLALGGHFVRASVGCRCVARYLVDHHL